MQIGAGVVGLIKQSHAEVVCMERVTGRGCHSYVCGGQLYCTLRPSVMTILCAGGLELCENLVLRDLLVWREGGREGEGEGEGRRGRGGGGGGGGGR